MTNTAEHQSHRVAILGGGIASLTTAWRLSEQPGYSVTVYQRGWRLGGKGASSRGEHDRIEEHGLHVWLGYYDNAFRMMRECYAELDRAATSPEVPISTWTDAFKPSDSVGLMCRTSGSWHQWMANFSRNDEVPGEPEVSQHALSPFQFIRRARSLVENFMQSLVGDTSDQAIVVSASPHPPRRPLPTSAVITEAFDAAIAATMAAASQPAMMALGLAGGNPMIDTAVDMLADAQVQAATYGTKTIPQRRTFELVDLVLTTVRGILTDGLLMHPRGFAAANDEEYRTWLIRHGASDETLNSPLIEGVYDLVFGFRGGNPDDPQFAAGTGVLLSSKIFFDYKGSIFWKMQAGMGDVVFAPLYEALKARGVAFEFFHEIDELVPADDGSVITSVTMARQAELKAAADEYVPIRDFGGLPCFPSAPDQDQLKTPIGKLAATEKLGGRPDSSSLIELVHGRDFDTIVFGLSVAMVPHTCEQLIAQKPQWHAMRNLGTVATQSAQLWLRPSETELGCEHPGSTITGYIKPFDTVASMSHLLDVEGWPDGDAPKSLLYLCNTLPDSDSANADSPMPHHYARAQRQVQSHTISFLENGGAMPFIPHAHSNDQFDWDHLIGDPARSPQERLNGQFVSANIDPSDRYVQSLPGTDRFRLRPDNSGYDNLILTGDWTDCGLNAGCIEAAAISGLQAANAIAGSERWHRISGHWRLLVGAQ